MSHRLLACVAASALLAVPALAQTSASPPAGTSAGSTAAPASGANIAPGNQATGAQHYITRREPGVWRASDLIGKDVYGANNEDMGEVGDVLIDRNGQVRAVVLDLGGFLGIGETQVAVPMQSLQFRSDDNRASTTASTGAAAGAAATGSNTAATTGASRDATAGSGQADRPDRIVLIITKDQLKNAPKFEDGSSRARPGKGATTAPKQ